MHKRQKMAAVWPHSIRLGREVATIMLIYIMALAYAPSSPLILPFALAYFAMSWCAARGSNEALGCLCGPVPSPAAEHHAETWRVTLWAALTLLVYSK